MSDYGFEGLEFGKGYESVEKPQAQTVERSDEQTPAEHDNDKDNIVRLGRVSAFGPSLDGDFYE